MANPNVITQFANPDPDAAPLNLTQLVGILNTLVSTEILGSYIPYVISHAQPSINDRDKAWIYLDTQGRPIEIRIWWDNAGAWRRVYNGMLGEVRMYNGNPATDFDTDGLGNIGGTYDGWHLCNGKDGTPDLSDRFPIAAHMNQAGGHPQYNSDGWVTSISNVDDEHTGGVRDVTLNNDNTYRPAKAAITAQRMTADGNAPDPAGALLGVGSGGTQYTLQGGDADPGKTDPASFSVVPPFTAIAFIIFVGYST
jgi:hypothetical protein